MVRREYQKPFMVVGRFVANECVANCGDSMVDLYIHNIPIHLDLTNIGIVDKGPELFQKTTNGSNIYAASGAEGVYKNVSVYYLLRKGDNRNFSYNSTNIGGSPAAYYSDLEFVYGKKTYKFEKANMTYDVKIKYEGGTYYAYHNAS